MAITATNILSLNHEEAIYFFMKTEQYHDFELPEYFAFGEVFKYVRDRIGDKFLRNVFTSQERFSSKITTILNAENVC